MAKKSKKNLQKILAKRQQLEQLSAATPAPSLPTEPKKVAQLPTEKTVTALPSYSHNRELLRTAISILIIAALLGGVIIFDRQRDDLTTFGNWLYSTLRLDQ